MNKLFSRRSSKVGPRVATKTTTTNFFSLPAELRNDIYVLATHDISLTVLDRSRKTSLNPPGLLLVSRQCRMEVLPILLANSQFTIKVVDFNFSNAMRVVGGLYKTELKALRQNENLMIVLDASHTITERDLMTNLRRWIKQQAQNIDRLPWRYRLAACGSVCTRLGQCGHERMLELLRDGSASREEVLGWEVRIMLESVDETWSDRIAPAARPKGMGRILMAGGRRMRTGST